MWTAIRIAILAAACGAYGCAHDVPPGPVKLTPEEEKVVAVAENYLKKTKKTWETPIEVSRPPQSGERAGLEEIRRGREEYLEGCLRNSKRGMRALGARTLFVNMRTNEVTPSVRR
jgi:hypothetical protein